MFQEETPPPKKVMKTRSKVKNALTNLMNTWDTSYYDVSSISG